MCGRFYIDVRTESLKAIGVQLPADFDYQNWNIAPSQSIPVVLDQAAGHRVVTPSTWGLLPHWAKSKQMRPMINARAETAAIKPYFRNAFKDGRCVIPASGFYEWKRDAGRKTPHAIALPDDNLMLFAGLYERDEDHQPNCAILTTRANEQMQIIHDRMPAILSPELIEQWIVFGNPNVLAPYEDELAIWPVSKRVNSPKNNDSSLISDVSKNSESDIQSDKKL